MITDELRVDAGDVRSLIVMAVVGGVPEEVWTVSTTHGIEAIDPLRASSPPAERVGAAPERLIHPMPR